MHLCKHLWILDVSSTIRPVSLLVHTATGYSWLCGWIARFLRFLCLTGRNTRGLHRLSGKKGWHSVPWQYISYRFRSVQWNQCTIHLVHVAGEQTLKLLPLYALVLMVREWNLEETLGNHTGTQDCCISQLSVIRRFDSVFLLTTATVWWVLYLHHVTSIPGLKVFECCRHSHRRGHSSCRSRSQALSHLSLYGKWTLRVAKDEGMTWNKVKRSKTKKDMGPCLEETL